jgi:hypothetical protein
MFLSLLAQRMSEPGDVSTTPMDEYRDRVAAMTAKAERLATLARQRLAELQKPL